MLEERGDVDFVLDKWFATDVACKLPAIDSEQLHTVRSVEGRQGESNFFATLCAGDGQEGRHAKHDIRSNRFAAALGSLSDSTTVEPIAIRSV